MAWWSSFSVFSFSIRYGRNYFRRRMQEIWYLTRPTSYPSLDAALVMSSNYGVGEINSLSSFCSIISYLSCSVWQGCGSGS